MTTAIERLRRCLRCQLVLDQDQFDEGLICKQCAEVPDY